MPPAPAHERYDDPPGPLTPHAVHPLYTSRGFAGQVNVDLDYSNIVGDAANEPSIAVDPRAPNRMVIAWRQFDSVLSNFRQAGYAWTNDGGRTWHPGVLDPGVFHSDPVIRANADGEMFYSALWTDNSSYRCDIFKTIDAGRNWTGPLPAFGGDKLWFAIDRGNGPGRNHIYQVWTADFSDYRPNNFSRAINAGAVFENPLQTFAAIWGTLAVGPLGELYIATEGVRMLKSVNAQNPGVTPTFSLLPQIPLGLLGYEAPPNPAGLTGQVWVQVDKSDGPRRGWIYVLASSQIRAGDPMDVNFVRSENGGASWSAVQRVNPDPAHPAAWQWFATMSIAPNGRLDVAWNDTSESLDPRLNVLKYSSSADGGVSWSAPIPLTPTWDSHLGWPNQEKIGDYYDMESDNLGADLAYAATLNGEQDVFYKRIGPHDCNRNGIGDAVDIARDPTIDCNHNQIPDSCEVAAGAAFDVNQDGRPDSCFCNADFDHDGDVGTDTDIEAFFECLSGSCCPTCGSPDFDGDGDVGTDTDIEVFFRVLGGLPC